jgi:hypothetical protein
LPPLIFVKFHTSFHLSVEPNALNSIRDDKTKAEWEESMASNDLFKTDSRGRTTLFYAAEIGDMKTVRSIIFKLTGTGISCQRLALIDHKDIEGLTAIDVARVAGNEEIAELLNGEKMRMEYFE